MYCSRSWEAIRKEKERKGNADKESPHTHRPSHLQVLVGLQGPDGGVSEFDVVAGLVRGVFVDPATGESIPMLLPQRCHFYN